MPDRQSAIDGFLFGTRWQHWVRTPIAADASARRYFRLSKDDQTTILMDAPPSNGEDTRPFTQLAKFLLEAGFAAPDILAHDASSGLLLLSDLGQTDFAQWLTSHPDDEPQLYQAAADVLLKLEATTPPKNLKKMTPMVGAEMVGIIGEHYTTSPTHDLCAEVETALAHFAPDPTILALRDYHAENLIWRPALDGLKRVGLLDFQDAFMAPAGYDLASLLTDARRDVSQSVIDETIAYFAARTTAGPEFRTGLACLGVQRNLRIMGVFARLTVVMGKPHYLSLMPRVWSHILQDLKNPELKNLKQAIMDTIPAPTPSHLKSLQE